MPNHKNRRANSVPNGTAPEEPLPHTKKFKMKNTTNTTPGNRNAVCTERYSYESGLIRRCSKQVRRNCSGCGRTMRVFRFHARPLKDL